MKFPRTFFKRIFSDFIKDHHLDLEIRCLHPVPGEFRPPVQLWSQSVKGLEGRWPEIKRLNRSGYNIHYTVVPRRPIPQGRKEHPLPDEPIIGCFWDDLDVGESKPFERIAKALVHLESAGPKPTIVVESGTGLHGYYILAHPRKIQKDRAEAILTALAVRFRGDPAAARLKRLMRVPNTYNWKDGKRTVCRVWYMRRSAYSVRELEDELLANETQAKPNNDKSQTTQDYYDLFLPHVKKLVRSGEFARGLCPFHDDNNPSFSVNVRTGRWVCFACGIEGNWTDFKRRSQLTDLDPKVGQSSVNEEFEWEKLPRFNPAKAPKTKWLVENIIPERGITMLVGAPGAFKSTFAVLLASAVSKCEEFLDRETRRRRVLYLDNENPPDVLKARNENMKLEMEANSRLRLWSMYDERPVPKLLDKKLRLIVKKSVEDGRKVFIILDHWSSFLRAGDGGETTGQTSQLLQELKHLCALGATILLLHHTRKYEKDIEYGGNDLRAKCDAIHTLVLHQDSIDTNKKIIRMDSFLKRHGGNSSIAFRPRVKNGQVVGFELTRDPRADERAKKRELVRTLILKNPSKSQHKIVRKAQEQGLSRDEARKILQKGTGKYWEVKLSAHGAKKYVLSEES